MRVKPKTQGQQKPSIEHVVETLVNMITYCRISFHNAEARWPLLRLWKRPIRFGMVGMSGVVVNTVVLSLLVWGVAMPVWLASVCATEVAILSNFTLNDSWTFRANRRHYPIWIRLLRFNSVAIGGLFITVGVVTGLTSFVQLSLLLANLLAIGCAMSWNYVLNCWWTWRSPAQSVIDDEPEIPVE